jgi:hypothetical protein
VGERRLDAPGVVHVISILNHSFTLISSADGRPDR